MNHSSSNAPSPGGSDYSSDPSTANHQKTGRSDTADLSQQQTGGKKSNGNSHQLVSDGVTFFKILVPSMAAGAIIGKGGETIAMLQQETQTRIKMSKATDYFPGTNERVCIVYGANPEGILQVHDFIAQKIRDKPDPSVKSAADYDNKQPAEREKQVEFVKILVPNSTAGMIIGKGGNYIKYIKEESGAYVQISQKAKDHAITERCITVIGDFNQNRKACSLILAKIFEDPQSNSCPNLSYADVVGPVPNYNPTGSPFANLIHGGGPHGALDHNGMPAFAGSYGSPGQFFANLRSTLRLSGYTEEATNEIIAAMSTLAHYGILGLGLGLGGLNMGYMAPMSGLNGTAASVDSGYVHSTGSSLTGGLSSSSMGGSPGGYADGVNFTSKSPIRYNGQQAESLDSSYTSQYDQSQHLQQQLSSNEMLQRGQTENWNSQRGGQRWVPHRGSHGNNGVSGNGAADGVVPSLGGEKTQISIEINENLVGALLGREGKNITEIETVCNTQIQVAPKKKFSQGRRAVSITGTQNAVQMTQIVINQRLAQAEEKRSQNENQSASNNSSPQQQMSLSPSSPFS
jgi:RNA-binding protein Nova